MKSKKMKRIIMAAMASMLMFGGIVKPVFANGANSTTINIEETIKEENMENISFKEYIGEMKEYLKDINKTDLTKLEKLYNESTALDKAEKFDEASKKWEEFDKILEKYFKEDFNCTDGTCLVEPMNFKEFIGSMKEYLKNINKTDLTQLEKLYNELTALDKAERFEESSKKWEEFDKILEKYYKEDFDFNSGDEIFISESISFKELIGSMKEYLKDINKTDLTKLEKLYNESVALDKEEKFEESHKKWEEFDKILEKYYKEDFDLNSGDEIFISEAMSFKELIGSMKEYLKDINKTDLTKLEKLYNESIALEKSEKFDEASKKWEEFDKILEKYFKEEL